METKETHEPIKAWSWDHQEIDNTPKPVNQGNSWETAIQSVIDKKEQETKEEAQVEIDSHPKPAAQDEPDSVAKEPSKSKWNPKNWF